MLLGNAKIATIDHASGETRFSYCMRNNGAIAIKGENIVWVGDADAIPEEYKDPEKYPYRDLEGRLITPALIDCHTHVVHGGNRAVEFEMRLNGAGYEEIARAGGGIVSTVTATRDASVEVLLASALPRVDALLAEGVCVIEVKSGYGLDRETELNMLRAARAIEKYRAVRIKTTFLGAHATPAEYKGAPDRYIDEVCIPTLRAAHAEGLVDAVDGFCEGIAFDTAQIGRVFDVARELDIPVKLHAEQLSNIGGTKLAASYGALSVDHVEYANEDDARAMAKSGSVAVLLPGAFYTLHETQLPPIEAFRKHGVPMAVATDCNPGTSPMTSMLLTMNMACTLFRLTPEEALVGATANAARALGLADTGQIKAGMRADLVIWNAQHPAELSYRIGFNPLSERIFGGVSVAQ
ncbi:imidazolonepropionase [Thalassospira alkalitolerans]|uniref:imidazolonepropionase n=1 Tax=Thalassospira alkalitolerans TaxID=1293890 RepID=UPI003C701B7F|tara:strand:- start:41850 stop:43076 length:1227 start_codon:yes stop_codon:yes gene_type:complete